MGESVEGEPKRFSLVDAVIEFVFVAGDDELGVEAANKSGEVHGPAIRNEDVDGVMLVDGIDPFEVSRKPLVTGVCDGNVFRSDDERDVVLDVGAGALVAGVVDDGDALRFTAVGERKCVGLVRCASRTWEMGECGVDGFVLPELGRGEDRFILLDESFRNGEVGVVVVEVTDEEEVALIDESLGKLIG